jgi:hypothetical protein
VSEFEAKHLQRLFEKGETLSLQAATVIATLRRNIQQLQTAVQNAHDDTAVVLNSRLTQLSEAEGDLRKALEQLDVKLQPLYRTDIG